MQDYLLYWQSWSVPEEDKERLTAAAAQVRGAAAELKASQPPYKFNL